MSDPLQKVKQKLLDEISTLEHELNIDLPKEIAVARAHGDLSENAEYKYAKERQGFVNARIAQLKRRMGDLGMLNLSNIPKDRSGYGSRILVLDIHQEKQGGGRSSLSKIKKISQRIVPATARASSFSIFTKKSRSNTSSSPARKPTPKRAISPPLRPSAKPCSTAKSATKSKSPPPPAKRNSKSSAWSPFTKRSNVPARSFVQTSRPFAFQPVVRSYVAFGNRAVGTRPAARATHLDRLYRRSLRCRAFLAQSRRSLRLDAR